MFGGLLAGLAVGLAIAGRGGFHVLRLLGAAAPSRALAIAIGRGGDCCYWIISANRLSAAGGWRTGSGSEVSWHRGLDRARLCRPGRGILRGCRAVPRRLRHHLTAAYHLLGSLLLFGVLLGLRRRVRYRAGVAFSVWALWYGAQGLGLDFLRGVDERPLWGLTGTQLLALLVVAASLISLISIAVRRRRWGTNRET